MADLDMEQMREKLARMEIEIKERDSVIHDQNLLLRATTFVELLEHCYFNFSDKLHVERDPSAATGGTTSSVDKKIRPKRLERWHEFLDLRDTTFSFAKEVFQTENGEDQRRFTSQQGIREHAHLARDRVSSEIDIRLYHHDAVEPFVKEVLRQLIIVTSKGEEPGKPSTARVKLGLGKGMAFENHANTLTKVTGMDRKNASPTYADQLCVKHDDAGNEIAVAVIELKPPHKATKDLIAVGLHPMVIGDIASKRIQDASSSEDKFQRSADRFIAMVVTQTFSYMVESGISHGCIITGEVMIFLFIREDDPSTVFYYHADPIAEVKDELASSEAFPHQCTSIGQLASFCLMAHRAPLYDQQWRTRAAEQNPRWKISMHEALYEIPVQAAELERPTSAYTPRRQITDAFRASPIPLRLRECKPKLPGFYQDPDSDEDQDGEWDYHETPTKQRHGQQGKGKEVQNRSDHGTHAKESSRGTTKNYAYCTQQCLDGLRNRGGMDPGCPNYDVHPKGKDYCKHALTRPSLARLLRQQLAEDRDDYLLDLGLQGATGRLFKLTLASHGYTFVAKGTTRDFIADSKREARVYQHLKARQGKTIPVYLGNIDLVRPWIGGGLYISHMLLMSFAGQCVLRASGASNLGLIKDEAVRFDEECVQMGALHTDTMFPNIMWNEERKNIMFVDFDRTILFNVHRPPRAVVSSDEYRSVVGLWPSRKTQAAVTKERLVSVEEEPADPLITPSDKRAVPSSSRAFRSDDFAIWSDEAEEMTSPGKAMIEGREDGVQRKQDQNQYVEDDKENRLAPSNGDGDATEESRGKTGLKAVHKENVYYDTMQSPVETAT
ncbi:MAG: hypothetical protein Q9219_007351 [cf. Caloplaca sp. 3 TL-2023]